MMRIWAATRCNWLESAKGKQPCCGVDAVTVGPSGLGVTVLREFLRGLHLERRRPRGTEMWAVQVRGSGQSMRAEHAHGNVLSPKKTLIVRDPAIEQTRSLSGWKFPYNSEAEAGDGHHR